MGDELKVAFETEMVEGCRSSVVEVWFMKEGMLAWRDFRCEGDKAEERMGGQCDRQKT